jgi:hypothetical protein
MPFCPEDYGGHLWGAWREIRQGYEKFYWRDCGRCDMTQMRSHLGWWRRIW